MDTIKEDTWHNHPSVIFAVVLVLYTISNSIIALVNF